MQRFLLYSFQHWCNTVGPTALLHAVQAQPLCTEISSGIGVAVSTSYQLLSSCYGVSDRSW